MLAKPWLRSPVLIACTLALMGIVLWIADVVGRQKKKLDSLYLGDAILIGLSQALAIIPGVSRSGSTITTGRLLGIERQDAAAFRRDPEQVRIVSPFRHRKYAGRIGAQKRVGGYARRVHVHSPSWARP